MIKYIVCYHESEKEFADLKRYCEKQGYKWECTCSSYSGVLKITEDYSISPTIGSLADLLIGLTCSTHWIKPEEVVRAIDIFEENAELPLALQACPFCSSISKIFTDNHGTDTYRYHIQCTKCRVSGPEGDSIQEASYYWNGISIFQNGYNRRD